MNTKNHLLLGVPEDWTNDEKGEFFEEFVKEILRPMRFRVQSRLRFTGMELDVLATNIDHSQSIIVECKAHRDPVSADTITKILGNVHVRKVDSGWLFSTSDLTKDGRGLCIDIENDQELNKRFSWYPPEKLIDILIDQHSIVKPEILLHYFRENEVGDWTLVISPSQWVWIVQIIHDGTPTHYSTFDARKGAPLSALDSRQVTQIEPRFNTLEYYLVGREVNSNITSNSEYPSSSKLLHSVVANVIPGDSWDDLRPARPHDFVGRDDVINDITQFLDQVRFNNSLTRTFAIQSPSGWGKSSLVLKLADLSHRGKIAKCNMTVIDTRSAANLSFVAESVRIAFLNAAKRGLVPNLKYNVTGLNHPLDQEEFKNAMSYLASNNAMIVIIFDQFEELFSKEELFETFNAVKELSLDIDGDQLPIVLGFAWKSDISLPQQHPAYHLWHQLNDRRKTVLLRQFGRSDILKIIVKAEKESGVKLSSAIKTRMVEQCQGYPWLLKKLLVHILRQVPSIESQYLLLDQEMNIERLFEEDLADLSGDQIACIKYVAENAPVVVSDVEENYSRDTANSLIDKHLLVRSGMNYVIYWDIFRDYLLEKRVPHIPWARTFQVTSQTALRAYYRLREFGLVNSYELANDLGVKDGACFNIVSDLAALQLIDRMPNDFFKCAENIRNHTPLSIAEHVRRQLVRHIVVIEMNKQLDRGQTMLNSEWDEFFLSAYPHASEYSEKTIHTYAANLRRWLVFSGLLEWNGVQLTRPIELGNQMGVFNKKNDGRYSSAKTRVFLGQSTPEKLIRLINTLKSNSNGLDREKLVKDGYRNAIYDAIALKIIQENEYGILIMLLQVEEREIERNVKRIIMEQQGIRIIADGWNMGELNDRIRNKVKQDIGPSWKESSLNRNYNALKRYYKWALL